MPRPARQGFAISAAFKRFVAALILIITGSVAGVAPASAAELLLYTRKGCAYCVLWEREIGGLYPKTDEARTAPLRRVQTDRPQPGDPRLDPPVSVTPTFVLMDGAREIGRFSGYTNDLTFWSMLTVLLQRMAEAERPPAASPAGFRP